MNLSTDLTCTIERIKQMELYFDKISAILQTSKYPLQDLEALKVELAILEDYYDSGQWLDDYETDESGALPSDLKRGVLAQDSLYDLFSDIKDFVQ